MDKLKFALNILNKSTIEEKFTESFDFQVQKAISAIGLYKESVFNYMPLEKSDNLFKILDIIEKNKLYKELEVDIDLGSKKRVKP